MKRVFGLIILFCSITSIICAQVETHYYCKGEAPILRKSNIRSVPIKHMPVFDIEKVRKENAEKDARTGLRHFGKGFDVSYTLADGTWEETDGGRLWTMTFESSGARSLNFVFNDFFLPEGAELYVSNEDESVVFGPVTHEAIHENGHFLTDIISGSQATISLYEPFDCMGQSTLTIKRVVHGILGGQPSDNTSSEIRSQYTYNDSTNVACYSDYNEVSDGVGLLFTSDGLADASCSLVMTTDYSFKPYILTTYFFIDYNNDGEISNQEKYEAENCMVKFRCRYSTCNGITPVTSYTYNQSYFRSAYRPGGMGLLELKSSLTGNPNLTWLGWNRYGTPTPLQGATLYHSEDQKLRIALCNCHIDYGYLFGFYWTKISHYHGYPSGYCQGAPFLNNSQRVFAITIAAQPHYEEGILQHNTLIMPLLDSWDGGLTNSTGLAHWLDPEGKGWLVTPSPSSRVMNIVGLYQIISSRSYYIQNLPSDMTVTWSLSDSYYNQNCLQQNTPGSNQCTITRSPVQEMTNATLTATVKRYGQTICTFHKLVTTCDGFDGTYYNGVTTKEINLPSPLVIQPGAMAVITSPNLIGATVTQTGGNLTPTYMAFNGAHNALYLGMPLSPSGAIILGVSCSNGSYYSLTVTNTLTSSLLSVTPSGNQLNISLTPSPVTEDVCLEDAQVPLLPEREPEAISSGEWYLEVCNAQTGERMTNMKVCGTTLTLDTSSWSTGVYVVRATIGKEVYCEKVYVK